MVSHCASLYFKVVARLGWHGDACVICSAPWVSVDFSVKIRINRVFEIEVLPQNFVVYHCESHLSHKFIHCLERFGFLFIVWCLFLCVFKPFGVGLFWVLCSHILRHTTRELLLQSAMLHTR